jgi:hypothetical protein
MGEPKAFASLSSGLLARKGAARPAMRPQGFGQIGSNGLEDLGWNDMGFEAPKPANGAEPDADHDAFGAEIQPLPIRNPLAGLTPVGSPVHDQQEEIAARFAAEDDGEEYDEDYDETAEVFENVEAEIAALCAAQPDEPVAFVAEPVAEVAEPVLEVVQVAEPVALTVAPQPQPVAPRRATKARSAPGSKAKAAFTLRLDKARHLKLRLACAVSGRSAQQLVTDALDALLATMPELDSMADKAPGSKN